MKLLDEENLENVASLLRDASRRYSVDVKYVYFNNDFVYKQI